MIQLFSKPVALEIQKQVRARAQHFLEKQKRPPGLAVVLVGNDPASLIYTRKKGDTANLLGMEHRTISLSSSATPSEVYSVVQELNQNERIDGILIQRPLPKSFHEEEVVYWVNPAKDVDAFHPENTGRLLLGLPCLQPCTPAGIMALLNHYKITVSGKLACVIGRSSIVGKPMANLLLKSDATLLHCHSKTPDLRAMTKQAEILIVATGQKEFIDRSYIRSGAVIVDVGVHRNQDGKIVGDIATEGLEDLAYAITPVPGGVGPMTISMLMQNTLLAAERRALIS